MKTAPLNIFSTKQCQHIRRATSGEVVDTPAPPLASPHSLPIFYISLGELSSYYSHVEVIIMKSDYSSDGSELN
jgi:hypothetical protein